jgi:hypothetical protein
MRLRWNKSLWNSVQYQNLSLYCNKSHIVSETSWKNLYTKDSDILCRLYLLQETVDGHILTLHLIKSVKLDTIPYILYINIVAIFMCIAPNDEYKIWGIRTSSLSSKHQNFGEQWLASCYNGFAFQRSYAEPVGGLNIRLIPEKEPCSVTLLIEQHKYPWFLWRPNSIYWNKSNF